MREEIVTSGEAVWLNISSINGDEKFWMLYSKVWR